MVIEHVILKSVKPLCVRTTYWWGIQCRLKKQDFSKNIKSLLKRLLSWKLSPPNHCYDTCSRFIISKQPFLVLSQSDMGEQIKNAIPISQCYISTKTIGFIFTMYFKTFNNLHRAIMLCYCTTRNTIKHKSFSIYSATIKCELNSAKRKCLFSLHLKF